MRKLYNIFIVLIFLFLTNCSNKNNFVENNQIKIINSTQKNDTISESNIESDKDSLIKNDDSSIENIEFIEDPQIKKRNSVQNTYMSQVGIREKTGHNDGKEVEMYLKSAGLSKGNPWCASFVTYVYKECGINTPKTGLGWVPSYFPPKKTIYVRGKYSKMKPKYGDLIGIWFPEKKRLAHIGFYDNEDDKYFYSVEGNTNQAGSREGDGVYIKRRVKGQVHSISNWIDD